jgi:hypothetical protein
VSFDFDRLIRGESDRALTRRFCRILILAPLITVPPTLLLGLSWLDASVPLEHRTFGDVLLLHLPGLVNAYPAWSLARRGRIARLPIGIAILGLFMYVLPNLLWLLLVGSWRQQPPLLPAHFLVTASAVQSGVNSLALWVLVLTWYDRVRRDNEPWTAP